MTKRSLLAAGGALGALLAASAAAHAQTSDPAGDFLPTYLAAGGPATAGDLDVLSANVTLIGNSFLFTSTLNGPVGSTAGGFYVWGLDRGAGTARFGALADHVLFDSVVTLRPGGTSAVNDLIQGVSTNLAPASITITGNTIQALVPVTLLPSQAAGITPDQYTWNLWPRLGSLSGNNQISDFAPNNSNVRIAAAGTVPEPSSFSLFGLGLLPLLGWARRRRYRSPGA